MRGALRVLLAGLVVLALGWFGYTRWFGGGHGADLRVLEVVGKVVLTRAGQQDRFVQPGTGLQTSDGLAVGEGSRAVVGVGAETRLTLEENSSIRVLEAGRDGVRVELEQGRVSARVQPGSPALGLSNGGRTLTATDATFDASVDPDGLLVAQTTQGSVQVAGVGDVRALPAGSRLRDLPGSAPVMGEIPAELLLEVDWPSGGAVRAPTATLTGRTEPLAKVRAQGAAGTAEARAGPDGSFSLQIPLAEGSNPVRLDATDGVGGATSADGALRRDSTAPSATSAKVLWDR